MKKEISGFKLIGIKFPGQTTNANGQSAIDCGNLWQQFETYCVANAWKEIWSSTMHRAYGYDFEIYDEQSKDWSNAKVEIFVSV